MFQIQNTPIDPVKIRSQLADPACGAVVIFEGLVRNHHEGRDVTRLHYTHHPVLAAREGERVMAAAAEKFPSVKSLAVHRVGTLEIGDCAVIIATSSAHREAAYEANRFLIDSIKSQVPIWKEETYADGEVEWTSPCPNCGPAPNS